MDTWKLRVRDIRPETRDTKTIFLERADGQPFSYQAGQFLTLLFSFHGRELRRSYSFSTTPGIDLVPAITVKRVPNGEVSRYLLDHLQVDDELTTLPPAGRFVLGEAGASGMHSDGRHSLLFLAAGSGMVPIFSLLKKALAEKTPLCETVERPAPRIVLVTQHADENSILFKKALEEEIRKNHDRFHWISLLSRPNELLTAGQSMPPRQLTMIGQGWPSRQGRLNNWLLEALLREQLLMPEHFAVYLCGPPAFMRMAQFTLRLMGFSDTQLKKENFTVEYVPPPPLLTDTTPKKVTIYRKDSSFHFEAAWPDTILRAAEHHHISLPYSCRGGRCSTCTVKCLSGKVKMSINEVLTEKELKEGWILTCVGYAETDVELSFGEDHEDTISPALQR
jgi:ring-1,2-phenylacetyl-CoA epoxidase subunit PaaE